MATDSITSSAPLASEARNSLETEAPPLPKIGKKEQTLRVLALPISIAVGGFYFKKMARDGLQDSYADRNKLDGLVKEFDDDFKAKQAHPDHLALRKHMKGMIQKFDDGVTAILAKDGFTNTLHYFNANSKRNQLNILLSTGAAISISLGLIVTLLDPRNRSAITGLFDHVNKHSQPNEQHTR